MVVETEEELELPRASAVAVVEAAETLIRTTPGRLVPKVLETQADHRPTTTDQAVAALGVRGNPAQARPEVPAESERHGLTGLVALEEAVVVVL